MLVSLTFYALLGGADYGGGVWDVFARGPRANDQRALIARAIGPIWEANHVWLILVVSGFIHPWLGSFPFAVGLFALSLFAFLAAVYLTLETRDRKLQDDFRVRALVSGAAVAVLALIVFLLAGTSAPKIRAGISAT